MSCLLIRLDHSPEGSTVYSFFGSRCRKNTIEISELEAGPRGLRPEDIRFVRLVLRINGNKKF